MFKTLCSIVNKILAHVIWKSFSFILFKFKRNVQHFQNSGCKAYSSNTCFIQKLKICVQLKENNLRVSKWWQNFTFWANYLFFKHHRKIWHQRRWRKWCHSGNLPIHISIIKDGPLSAVITKRHIVWRHIVAPEITNKNKDCRCRLKRVW